MLTRYPDGITGKSFFQKDAPSSCRSGSAPSASTRTDVERDIDYFVVDDVETLRYVANLGTIPLHLWGSRVPALDHPDWLVLDLDPKGAPFTDVVKVARALRAHPRQLELPSYVKTSGATGLHILVPLGARYTHEETRTFARLLATLGVDAVPAIATIARPIRTRGGKVYVDFGQNGHGQTIVAPFSVRPLPGAPVSCPLRWDEVTPRLDPGRFTIQTAPARFEKLGDPLAPVLGTASTSPPRSAGWIAREDGVRVSEFMPRCSPSARPPTSWTRPSWPGGRIGPRSAPAPGRRCREILDRFLADGAPIAVATLVADRRRRGRARHARSRLRQRRPGRAGLPWSGTPTAFVIVLEDGRSGGPVARSTRWASPPCWASR